MSNLGESKRVSFNASYEISELVEAIKKSKLNRAPESDRFSNYYFFRLFLDERMFWIFRF